MILLATQTALWLALGLVALLGAIALPLLALYFAVLDGGADNLADVQRFIELSEEARRLLSPGLPLLDSDKTLATAASIVPFQAKKEEARRALWAPRDRRRAAAIAKSARLPIGRRASQRNDTDILLQAGVETGLEVSLLSKANHFARTGRGTESSSTCSGVATSSRTSSASRSRTGARERARPPSDNRQRSDQGLPTPVPG